MKTNYAGIDYSLGTGANRDKETGMRCGVIPHNAANSKPYENLLLHVQPLTLN